MKTYTIKDAITSSMYGPKLAFDTCYVDDYKFEAANDAEAIEKVHALQLKHDREYLEAGATQEDFENAPCYSNCLYEISDDAEDRKVEE